MSFYEHFEKALDIYPKLKDMVLGYIKGEAAPCYFIPLFKPVEVDEK